MIEITRFRLAPGTSRDEFAAADARLQTDFAYQQPGLLRRTAALGTDRDALVIDLWRSADDADACSARWGSDPAVREWLALVEDGSLSSERFFEFEG